MAHPALGQRGAGASGSVWACATDGKRTGRNRDDAVPARRLASSAAQYRAVVPAAVPAGGLQGPIRPDRNVGLVLVGGTLLWLFGRGGRVHVGASSLIYGLIAFLIVAGFRERRIASLAVAVLTGFLYGGTLLSGILPSSKGISWDGHLLDAVGGGIVAFAATGSDLEATDG